jgi:hypothetical protein
MPKSAPGDIFAFGRHLQPPYRVDRRGRTVRVGSEVVFSLPVARDTPPRDARARFIARMVRDFELWRSSGGLPFAQSKLTTLLNGTANVRSFEIYGGGLMLMFADGTSTEVLLQRFAPPPAAADEAEAFRLRLAECLALGCTVLLGDGYYATIPASSASSLRARLLAIARSRRSQAEREAELLEAAGERAMAAVIRGR